MESELMKKFNELAAEYSTRLQDVRELTHAFGRELTYDEHTLVIDNGKKALLNKLNLSEEDYNTMVRAIALISAGFTKSSEDYDYELEQENYKALDLFKSLVNDLEFVKERREVKSKVVFGNKKDLGTHIHVTGENLGYKEENDPDLDKIFSDSEKSVNPNNPIMPESIDEKADKELDKIFAAETKCDALHITGDTYTEDDQTWEEKYDHLKPEHPKEESLEDKINKIVERLDKGEQLELEEDLLSEVIDYLWESRNQIEIKIHNNKISIK